MTTIMPNDEVQAFRHRVFRVMAHGPDIPQPNIYRGYLPLQDTSNDAVEEYRAKFMTFMTSNWEGLCDTFYLLEDEYSKDLFINLLVFRAFGCNQSDLFSDSELYFASLRHSSAIPAKKSEFAGYPGGGSIKQYSLEINEKIQEIDCLHDNLFFTFFLKQYYLNRNEVHIKPELGDHVIDAGACFGDTAIGFSKAVGPLGQIYCFDPLDVHLQIMKSNFNRNGVDNVVVFPVGLGELDEVGAPALNEINPGFNTAERAAKIPLRSLDALVEDKLVNRVDFIKMDIEGYELQALRGAEKSLRKFKPKLAISLYHTWEDYIDIPKYINSLALGYRFYLENYTVSDGETVLYCTTDRTSGASQPLRDEGEYTSYPIGALHTSSDSSLNLDALTTLNKAIDTTERRVRLIADQRGSVEWPNSCTGSLPDRSSAGDIESGGERS